MYINDMELSSCEWAVSRPEDTPPHLPRARAPLLNAAPLVAQFFKREREATVSAFLTMGSWT